MYAHVLRQENCDAIECYYIIHGYHYGTVLKITHCSSHAHFNCGRGFCMLLAPQITTMSLDDHLYSKSIRVWNFQLFLSVSVSPSTYHQSISVPRILSTQTDRQTHTDTNTYTQVQFSSKVTFACIPDATCTNFRHILPVFQTCPACVPNASCKCSRHILRLAKKGMAVT